MQTASLSQLSRYLPNVSEAFATFPGANGKIAFESLRDGNLEIYTMNSDGSGQINVSNNAAADRNPDWSPDGTKIAFNSNRNNPGILKSEIFVMNADGTGQTGLTSNPSFFDRNPHWSPDGKKIAFVSLRDGNDEIYVMNADGTGQTRLTTANANDQEPSWSPDGGKIAFSSLRDGNLEIYTMNADGSNQINISNNPSNDGGPGWSPDGTKIAFWSFRDGNLEIYTMNADGTSQTRLTNNTALDEDPIWSPDGTKIVFGSNRDGNTEIYMMNADGTSQTRLTNNTAFDLAGSWQRMPADDLELLSAEPVQVVFGQSALVRGKDNAVRAEVRNSFDEDKTFTMKVVENIGGVTTTTITQKTIQQGSTKNFFISGTSPEGGSSYSVLVEIDPPDPEHPEGLIIEQNETNNSGGKALPVKDTRGFTILYKPIHLTGDPSPPPTCSEMIAFRAGGEFVVGTFPVDEDEFLQVTNCVPFVPTFSSPVSGNLTDAQEVELIVTLDSADWFTVFQTTDSIGKLVGVVRMNWFSNNTSLSAAGAAWPPLDPSIVEVDRTSGTVTAQEVAHTMGWVSSSPPGDPTDRWHMSNLPTQGFWVAKSMETTDIDFMHPFAGSRSVVDRWASGVTFQYLFDQFKVDPLDPPAVIGIRGIIFENDDPMIQVPWYTIDGGSLGAVTDIPLDNPGEYTLFYLDSGGDVIGQTGFDVNFEGLTHGETIAEHSSAPLSLRVPEVPGTKEFVIKHGDNVVGHVVVSPSAPHISLIAPNGGDIFFEGGRVNITWDSSDPDGVADEVNLAYVVSMSEDGGTTWIPLALDLKEKEFSFEVPPNMQTNSALIRVTATDGVNTANDVSDGPFKITQTPADTDGDGLTDNQEEALGTDPNDPDTDDDTLSDGAEVVNGTNPLAADSDDDGIGDAVDLCPNDPETLNGFEDSDGCPDTIPHGGANISIDDVTELEGNSGITEFVFTVTRSGNISGTSSATYAASDGTATTPSDYEHVSGIVVFFPNQTTSLITVKVNGDTGVEPNDTFNVFISPFICDGCVFTDDHGVGTIVNDDAAPPTGQPVGGEILGIDNVALLIAGATADAYWMVPIGMGIAASALFVVISRKRK